MPNPPMFKKYYIFFYVLKTAENKNGSHFQTLFPSHIPHYSQLYNYMFVFNLFEYWVQKTFPWRLVAVFLSCTLVIKAAATLTDRVHCHCEWWLHYLWLCITLYSYILKLRFASSPLNYRTRVELCGGTGTVLWSLACIRLELSYRYCH